MTLRLGEERPVRLPAADPGSSWTHEVRGMTSAVHVKRMWTSDPYPEDDEDETPSRSREMVFMVRARSPGRATIRFSCPGGTT